MIYNVESVAKYYNMNPQKIYAMIRKGELHPVKVGNIYLFEEMPKIERKISVMEISKIVGISYWRIQKFREGIVKTFREGEREILGVYFPEFLRK